MSEHHILSPSGASRWLACTPSARLEQLFLDQAGTAAEEGTLAHAISETLINRKLGRLNLKQFNDKLTTFKSHPLYDKEMLDYCEDYSIYVMERYHEAQTRNRDADIYLETRLDLSAYIPEGFGTGDINIISDDVLDFIDLKFGKGVKVYADKNKQLMIYGLGSYERYSMLYDIKRVRMTIYQPRLDHIDTMEMAIDDLLDWGRSVLIPRARMAYAGDGPYNPGDHCRFCRAKLTCRANADYQMEIAKFDFKQADLLSDDDIVDIHNRYDAFKNWIEGVEAYALAEALKGREWPGLKLVEGRGKRSWKDEDAVVTKLMEHGYETDQLYKKPELKGITDIQKLIGKRDFAVWLEKGNGADERGGLVNEPKGKPALASIDDPRPIYIPTAAEDFANLNTDEDV